MCVCICTCMYNIYVYTGNIYMYTHIPFSLPLLLSPSLLIFFQTMSHLFLMVSFDSRYSYLSLSLIYQLCLLWLVLHFKRSFTILPEARGRGMWRGMSEKEDIVNPWWLWLCQNFGPLILASPYAYIISTSIWLMLCRGRTLEAWRCQDCKYFQFSKHAFVYVFFYVLKRVLRRYN